MRICVIAGMIDAKLRSKILPLQAARHVEAIDLVRRRPYRADKIHCHSPPGVLLRWLPLAELWRCLSLLWLALARRPAVIVAFGTVPHGVYAWLAGKLFRIPVIQHVMGKNDLRLTFEKQSGRSMTLAAVRGGDLVAVRGDGMADWLTDNGVAREKIFVPQNVHDFDLFRPQAGVEAAFDLVYVGLLSRYKRVDRLLHVLRDLRTRKQDASLLLLGDGDERQKLEQLASDLGIDQAVEFAGYRAHEDLPADICRARVFIMTSQGEGLPMAMIEAMSCGLPAIVPADADIQMVARDGYNALVVDAASEAAYVDAACQLLGDAGLYDRLRGGALSIREEKAEEYSSGFQAGLWQAALEKAAGAGS